MAQTHLGALETTHVRNVLQSRMIQLRWRTAPRTRGYEGPTRRRSSKLSRSAQQTQRPDATHWRESRCRFVLARIFKVTSEALARLAAGISTEGTEREPRRLDVPLLFRFRRFPRSSFSDIQQSTRPTNGRTRAEERTIEQWNIRARAFEKWRWPWIVHRHR